MTAPTPAWQVINQVEASETDQTGNFVAGWKVYFQTASGISGSVFVPKAIYSADNVRNAIAAQVSTIMDVAGLTG